MSRKTIPKMTEGDVHLALSEIEAWRRNERGKKLTWEAIARTVGFRRQSLWARAEVLEAFQAAKRALREGKSREPAEAYAARRIESLKSEVAGLRAERDTWIEKFVRITYHLNAHNLHIDQFDQPLPPAARQ